MFAYMQNIILHEFNFQLKQGISENGCAFIFCTSENGCAIFYERIMPLKRLKNILLKMEPNTQTYNQMYEGNIHVVPPTGLSFSASDNRYFSNNIGFEITRSHKLEQSKPTITIKIPAEEIFINTNGADSLKRLKHYLLNMEPNTKTYKEMYDGKMLVIPTSPNMKPWDEYSNSYYDEKYSYTIDLTHKLAQDKQTITANIPVEDIGIDSYTTTAADYCLREFGAYIDALNTANYNRSRPDDENGKYYLYKPSGEVLVRNTAFFQLCPQKDYENGGNTVYLLKDDISRPRKMCLCIRMQVQLPKKKIRKTIQMLCRDLPDAVDSFVHNFDTTKLNEALVLAEKQAAIRLWMKSSEYCCFIANGSILPRLKGSELPMENAKPFISIPVDEIEV